MCSSLLSFLGKTLGLFLETMKEKVPSHPITKNDIQWGACIFPYSHFGSIVKCKPNRSAIISKYNGIVFSSYLLSDFRKAATIVFFLEHLSLRYLCILEIRNVCRTKGHCHILSCLYNGILLGGIYVTALL